MRSGKRFTLVYIISVLTFLVLLAGCSGSGLKEKSRSDVEKALDAVGISRSDIQYSGSETLVVQTGSITIAYVYEGDENGKIVSEALYNQLLTEIQNPKFNGRSEKIEKSKYKYIIVDGTDSRGSCIYGGVYMIEDKCYFAGADDVSGRNVVKQFLDKLGYPCYDISSENESTLLSENPSTDLQSTQQIETTTQVIETSQEFPNYLVSYDNGFFSIDYSLFGKTYSELNELFGYTLGELGEYEDQGIGADSYSYMQYQNNSIMFCFGAGKCVSVRLFDYNYGLEIMESIYKNQWGEWYTICVDSGTGEQDGYCWLFSDSEVRIWQNPGDPFTIVQYRLL